MKKVLLDGSDLLCFTCRKALTRHLKKYPQGMPLYNGKSRTREQYFGFISIRETKDLIIVEEF